MVFKAIKRLIRWIGETLDLVYPEQRRETAQPAYPEQRRETAQPAYDRETTERARQAILDELHGMDPHGREAAKLKRFEQELRTLERKDWSKELRKFVEWVEYMQTPEAFKRAKAENVVIIPSFEEDEDEPD